MGLGGVNCVGYTAAPTQQAASVLAELSAKFAATMKEIYWLGCVHNL